ncbi:hypothetical protein AVEN_11089-1, partial [Araneus ventricosus]
VPLTWNGRAGGWWKSPNTWCWAGGGWQSSTQQRGGVVVGGPRCKRADGEWVRVVRTLARDAQTLGAVPEDRISRIEARAPRWQLVICLNSSFFHSQFTQPLILTIYRIRQGHGVKTPGEDESGSRDTRDRKFGEVSFMYSPNIVFEHILTCLFTGAVEGPGSRNPEQRSRR